MNIKKLIIFLCFFSAYLSVCSSYVYAQVIIQRPVPQSANSDFGMRDGRFHNGTDYPSPTGTIVNVTPGYIGSPVWKPNNGGAGRTVDLNYNCGVTLQHFHLQSYTAGPPPQIATNNTGRSTGAHLHFVIKIDGIHVDPEAAYGLDLCDPTIRECLKTDGQQRKAGAIARGEDQGVCGAGDAPYQGPAPLVPPTDSGTPPMDAPTTTGRPPITPSSTAAPSLSGGYETGVGPPPGGPVLWDSSEYAVGNLTNSACDLDLFVTMRGRAAMEAQEDVVTSEIVVHRPDSVLEYTCADQFMGYTAEHADEIFSGSDFWVGRSWQRSVGSDVQTMSHLDPMSLDQVLEAAVVSTIYSYVMQQFPYPYLGGTHPQDNTLSPTIGGASYTCSHMNDIWNIAKCENFGDTRFFAGPGPFYTFNELIPAAMDPRVQHGACGDTGLAAIDMTVFVTNMCEYIGCSPASIPGTNMNDYVDPASCNGFPPIPTGIDVVKVENFGDPSAEDIIEYEEHFCANPGCYYNYDSGACEK